MKGKTFNVLVVVVVSVLFGLVALLPYSQATLKDPGMPPSANVMATLQQSAVEVVSVTADATALAYNTSSWADAVSLFVEIPVTWNYISWSFYGYGDGDGVGSPDGATFSYDLHVVDYYGGVETIIAAATGTIGKQQLSHNPVSRVELNSGAVSANYCWADTLSETVADWAKEAGWSNNSGNDYRAKGRIDRLEAYGVYIEIYDMTAQPVTSITAVLTGG